MLASVILPTRNRAASLRETLLSLSGQSLPHDRYEVIVVDDGSSDNTLAVLGEPWPFPLRTISHANKGAVESRNIASEAARGELLVFVDDDMWLDPRYLESLVELHAAAEPRIGMGSLLPDSAQPVSLLHRIYAQVNADPQPFPPELAVSFTHCVTNNLSVRRDDFLSLGMFRNPVGDGPGTWADVEFGCRVHRAGLNFRRSGRALCMHRDYSIHDFETVRKRAYRVGRATAALLDAHPWVQPHLTMFEDMWPVDLAADGARKILRKLARRASSFALPLLALEAIARFLTKLLPFESLLRPVYRWSLGAKLCQGLCDGMREACFTSAKGIAAQIGAASKG